MLIADCELRIADWPGIGLITEINAYCEVDWLFLFK